MQLHGSIDGARKPCARCGAVTFAALAAATIPPGLCPECRDRAQRSRRFYRVRVTVLLVVLAGVLLYAWNDISGRRARNDWIAAPPLRAGALATLARALLSSGRAASALPIAREAFAQLESLGSLEEGESLVRLVHAEALNASGDEGGFRRAIAAAHEQLLARAAKISDPTWRARFLSSVPDNARIIELATR